MCGNLSKSFLAKKRIKKGMLVQFGWYYRNSPFIDTSSDVCIVLDDPTWDLQHEYQKLKKKGDIWDEETLEEPGYSATIMTPSGVHKKYSVYNLVSVGVQNE
tara:strand:+ start:1503 stop:1808 length:306 start_codon:yes stop_codon:yes gene_type:complete